ncbi:hypothetical protein FRC03_003216 [Tulasnella sp. 419]|nr:hypothetical protein FRC03_003216 [Tulasnella sp. 419]
MDTDLFDCIASWLFGHTSSTLRMFDWGDDLMDDLRPECLSFLKHHGKNLISFSSCMLEEDITRLNINLSEICPLLRVLKFSLIALTTHDIRKTIPTAFLEELELLDERVLNQNVEEKAIDEVVQWVMSIPNLKHLTLRTDKPRNEIVLAPWIKAAAHVRMVFRYSDDVTFDDPIRPTHFPRGRRLRNLR